MKIIAITSLALNALVIGTGAGLYFNRGKIIDMALDKVKGEIPSLVKGSIPSLPLSTGPVKQGQGIEMPRF